MSASIDTSITHHFLTVEKRFFVAAFLLFSVVLGVSVSVHFTDWQNNWRGPSAYYSSFLLIPAVIGYMTLAILRLRRNGKYAVSVDKAGICDNRVVSTAVRWCDIEHVRFKSLPSYGKSAGRCEITLRDGREVSWQPHLTNPFLRWLDQGSLKKSRFTITSVGIKSGFRQLKKVIMAFVSLHPHIRSCDETVRSKEQA